MNNDVFAVEMESKISQVLDSPSPEVVQDFIRMAVEDKTALMSQDQDADAPPIFETNVLLCDDCLEDMPIMVCSSISGYFLGFHCENCGPWSRVTSYIGTFKEAKGLLNSLTEENFKDYVK